MGNRSRGGTIVDPAVNKLVQSISQRPAAQRAAKLADPLQLKTEFDEQTRRALFPQNV